MAGGDVDVVGHGVVMVTYVEGPAGFKEKDFRRNGRGRPVLDTARHREHGAFGEYHGALAVVLAQGDVQLAVDDEEELVRAVVDVPDVLAVGLYHADVVVVDRGDDARTPPLGERAEGLRQHDRCRRCGGHEAIVPVPAATGRVLEMAYAATILARCARQAAPGSAGGGRELQSVRDELRD